MVGGSFSRFFLLAVALGGACAYVVPHRPALSSRRASATMVLPSDDELFAALRARMEQGDSKNGMPPPKGPDEVGADAMGPSDVVEHCMRSLLAQANDGCSTDGCRAMLSFAIKVSDKVEDFVGQLQPGFFSDPQAFTDYIAAQPRYNTLTRIDEYKTMGSPDFSDMSRKAVQKLLVRKAGSNWEDLMINMQVVETGAESEGGAKMKRWLITSIYKQNGPPDAAA